MKISKETLNEIVELANSCPEKYQEKCFEILLGAELNSSNANTPERSLIPDEPSNSSTTDRTETSHEISKLDLHIKTQNFLEKFGIEYKTINRVFYKEGGAIRLMVDDLKTTRSSEVQVKLGLISAFINAVENGSFDFDGEAIRALVQERKAYDKANFAANFKNNGSLFESLTSYSKQSPTIKLSEAGKAELATLIKDLAD